MKARNRRTLLTIIRRQLGTWPQGIPAEPNMDREITRIEHDIPAQFQSSIHKIREFGELFVGMANGPFLLVMKADRPEKFVEYADQNPVHDVFIKIEENRGLLIDSDFAYQTIVTPATEGDPYRLTFGLPKVLEDKILLDSSRGIRLAPGIKKTVFSEIAVYRRVGDRDAIYRLVYTPDRTSRPSKNG